MNQAVVKRPKNIYSRYHAHVYFEAATLEHARDLCERAGERFGVSIGRVHQKPVGPHPYWSCQIAFDSSQFADLIAWLERNRQGLTILVHGLTGDDLADHTQHAAWLGEPAELSLEGFRADSCSAKSSLSAAVVRRFARINPFSRTRKPE